jgi:serine/threonine protein kinase
MDRWRRIEALFDEAVKQPPSDRDAHLRRACAQDLELYREVTSLLSHDADGTTDESWAARAAEALLEERSRLQPFAVPLTPGARLGPYEIAAPIGAGGMGEVYKARDTRLDRTVAIKILPAAIPDDADQRARFEREARAVAALNHPHICTLYDVGPDYFVMEMVDGQPLAGPLPLARALEFASQILSALDAAHRKGITHRDLKPGNILVTKQGIKLLDFGLAKLGTSAAVTSVAYSLADAPSQSPTTQQTVTDEHMILGTVQYMSPEQAQGKPADARSDIFSFGLVLYEMLTGQRAFDGTNPASVMAAILERDVPSVAGVVPPALERLLQRCLAKDPEARYCVGDRRAALDDVASP